jgi:branched-chain amino acid transport system substrate-binding protein
MATAGLPKRSRAAGSALVVAAMALLSTACGIRVDPATSTANAGATAAYSAPTGQAPGSGGTSVMDASAAGPVTSGSSATGSGNAAVAAGTAGTGGPAVRGNAGTAGRSVPAAQSSSAGGPGGPAQGGGTKNAPEVGTPGGPPTPGAGLPADSAKKSPLIVATMCNCSGPAGSSTVPMIQGTQIWLKLINGRGGLNGHAVKQVLYDDGSDPARNRAEVQEAVERQHAIAFFMEAAPLSAKASIDYITSKGIPVVGTDLADAWDYESPMYFPQASADRPSIYAAVAGAAQQLVPAGKTKLGLVYCAEAEQCSRIEKGWAEFAPKVGFQVAYESPVSLAQPDFTAVCLSARNAGAQAVAVLADTNTVTRFAASCNRQGYRPVITGMSQTVADRFRDDPGIENYVGVTTVFPFFQSGTPATDEYHEALRSQGGGATAGVGTATGWAAAKLLEKVGANLPEPPTSDAILKGLWSLRADDLGGLTYPLSFAQGQTATKTACWFLIGTKDSKWVSPDGFQRHCAPNPVS